MSCLYVCIFLIYFYVVDEQLKLMDQLIDSMDLTSAIKLVHYGFQHELF